ncbi:MAG: nucleoside monophosphate kinase [Candidatus Zambryskibacteria bacterium]
MQPQTFIFFGPSGCGKGTQAELLINYLKEKDPERKTLYLETGEKFREFIKTDSFTSSLTKEIVESGGLMPEFMPIWIWAGFLVQNMTGSEHIIFDGLSRRKEEAPVLDSAIKFYKRENPIVISIEISDEVAVQRLLGRGRKDDGEEGARKRLNWYKENVVPAIEFFKNDSSYKFISINGEHSIEEVHKEIMEKVGL